MPVTGTRPWRITRGCTLRWHCWDDEHLVYNCGSGDTHLLDALAAEILRKIEEAPKSNEELEEWLSGRISPDTDPEISSYLVNLLGQLHALCLIEEVAP